MMWAMEKKEVAWFEKLELKHFWKFDCTTVDVYTNVKELIWTITRNFIVKVILVSDLFGFFGVIVTCYA
jgi:hypothetical protein